MSKNVLYHVIGHIHDQNGRYIESVDEKTSAVSTKRAISNILFRWKKSRNIPACHKYKFNVKTIEEI